MGLPRNQLGTDEVVVRHIRTHGKALVGPVAVLILLSAVLGGGIALVPPEWDPWGTAGVVGLVVVAAIAWVVIPFLRWRTTTYTITNRRIITRSGLLTRTGHDLPLVRVNDVTYERHLLDRILGCGTLHLSTIAADPVILRDVPDVERVHVEMTDLLFGTQAIDPRSTLD
ncbi:MAG TPA: PH domain-containing protein [Propionibacteriaceae bacterium]|nr:PH domain-containing protein [Propionibacteriaceae bacterium]